MEQWPDDTPQDAIDRMNEMAREGAEVDAELRRVTLRLADAERVISSIGLCSPAPHEARERYEKKYGPVADA